MDPDITKLYPKIQDGILDPLIRGKDRDLFGVLLQKLRRLLDLQFELAETRVTRDERSARSVMDTSIGSADTPRFSSMPNTFRGQVDLAEKLTDVEMLA